MIIFSNGFNFLIVFVSTTFQSLDLVLDHYQIICILFNHLFLLVFNLSLDSVSYNIDFFQLVYGLCMTTFKDCYSGVEFLNLTIYSIESFFRWFEFSSYIILKVINYIVKLSNPRHDFSVNFLVNDIFKLGKLFFE